VSDVDAAKLPVMLNALRLPTIGRIWQDFGARADREGWGSARFLAAICDHELAERAARRIARHMAESGLPQGKTFATLDFAAIPTIRKAQVMALAEGDAWIEQGGNLLIFGPSGTGKTHLAAAFGAALVDNGKRVLFTRTTDLVQKLQAARRDLALPGTLAKLDRFDVLVLDDLGYVRKDQAETNVLFELIAERYERRSLIATCNQPFSEWDQIFPDPTMTVAAIDRLVHHATILELNTESYRRRSALASAAKAASAARA
jgi:DNA replication protein DnaC